MKLLCAIARGYGSFSGRALPSGTDPRTADEEEKAMKRGTRLDGMSVRWVCLLGALLAPESSCAGNHLHAPGGVRRGAGAARDGKEGSGEDPAERLKVILLPRPFAPVISMVTCADVGSGREPERHGARSHLRAHGVQGTTTIEQRTSPRSGGHEAEDAAFLALRAERLRRPKPDEARLKPLEEAFRRRRTTPDSS